MKSERIKLGYETEKAYWAGFIDGEGSIMISKHFSKDGLHKSPTYQVRVDVASTNKKIIETLRKFANCGWLVKRIFKKENQNDAYYWGCKSDKAIGFLEKLLPYLKLKRKQVLLVINFQQNKNSPNRNGGKIRKLSKKEISYREKMRKKLQDINAINSNKGKYWRDKNKKRGETNEEGISRI